MSYIARGRSAPTGPRWPDLALDLPSIRQSVLRVPHCSALSVDAEDVPRRALDRLASHTPGPD